MIDYDDDLNEGERHGDEAKAEVGDGEVGNEDISAKIKSVFQDLVLKAGGSSKTYRRSLTQKLKGEDGPIQARGSLGITQQNATEFLYLLVNNFEL